MGDFDRRDFLKGGIAAALAGATTGACARDSAAPTLPAAPEQLGPQGHYQPQFFNPDDMKTVSAAVDRFIPADDLSPSATDMGVAEFIDRQLAGPFGSAARWYMQGPFHDGLPTQGYQSKRTPAELIRDGVRALDKHVQAKMNTQSFDQLSADNKDKLLAGIESGDIELDGIDGKLFFIHFLQLAKEGFLADPMYGGNRDMAGWKMIGFPGARGNYYQWPDKTDQPYPYPPVSIKGA